MKEVRQEGVVSSRIFNSYSEEAFKDFNDNIDIGIEINFNRLFWIIEIELL